jgi:glycosyltransferase involved in cell wall biosynthesis
VSDTPRPSVVVCTRDRRQALGECLGTLTTQVALPEGLEIVVVDNGSSDGTAEWLARWAAEDPMRRRIVVEPVAGLSRARNRGVAAATGDVVLFLDDDASAPRGWVAAHVAAYDRDSSVVAAGGPVVLTWPFGRPEWLEPILEHWFSALDLGDEPQPWPDRHGPYGTNMSFRRSAVLAAGGFDLALERRGRGLISSEERALVERIWEQGGVVAYEPAALMLHRVQAERITRRWVLRRGWAQGRSNARLRALSHPLDRLDLGRVCREELGHLGRDATRVLRAVAHRDQPVLLDELARRAGHLSGALEQVRLFAGDHLGGGGGGGRL